VEQAKRQGDEMTAPESRLNEARAIGLLDTHPGKWFCASCWREAMSSPPEDEPRLSALARSKLRTTLGAVYEVDTNACCDVLGMNCQTKNEEFYKHGGRALSVRRRADAG
jgi:hypothetical protein